jgi:hypothetical protein
MEIWVNKMRFSGTFIPPTTGHLPIALQFKIVHDDYSLSSETRPQPGSGITFMICKA